MSEIEARKRGRPRSFHEDSQGKIVQSLDKALQVLKTVAAGPGLSLTEVSETSGVPAPTAYRALITMQKHGIVAFDEATQLWRIGVEAFRVGSSFLSNTSIVEQARPVMQALMQETGETANLGIISGAEVVFLSQVETHEPIRAFFRPGTHGSIHSSGIGKVLFSFQPRLQAEQLLQQMELERFTPNTLCSPEDMLQMRSQTLSLGFAIDDEERTLGMLCIAAPIFNSFGEAVAGLSVSGPTVRMKAVPVQAMGERVCAAADLVTRNAGGNRPKVIPE